VKAKELLPACFVLLTALLVWPLLSIANRPVLLAGVPALVAYLSAVWLAIIAILLVAARGAGDDPP
jgi:hypothetical protein